MRNNVGRFLDIAGTVFSGLVIIVVIGLAWAFVDEALDAPVGYYFGSELLGVGVVEEGQFVQYELEDFLAKYGEVPRHEAVQVGPNWQPRQVGEGSESPGE